MDKVPEAFYCYIYACTNEAPTIKKILPATATAQPLYVVRKGKKKNELRKKKNELRTLEMLRTTLIVNIVETPPPILTENSQRSKVTLIHFSKIDDATC